MVSYFKTPSEKQSAMPGSLYEDRQNLHVMDAQVFKLSIVIYPRTARFQVFWLFLPRFPIGY